MQEPLHKFAHPLIIILLLAAFILSSGADSWFKYRPIEYVVIYEKVGKKTYAWDNDTQQSKVFGSLDEALVFFGQKGFELKNTVSVYHSATVEAIMERKE